MPGRWERRRLARAVRRHARSERDHYHRGGVVELSTIGARAALYEQIAQRLEDTGRPLERNALATLKRLLAESPPMRDYGTAARTRNDRIAAILAELDGGRG